MGSIEKETQDTHLDTLTTSKTRDTIHSCVSVPGFPRNRESRRNGSGMMAKRRASTGGNSSVRYEAVGRK